MQTDATNCNNVSPTIMGVVGTCCMVHANERNNCQHCWRSSKEAMQSGTVLRLLLKNPRCNARTKTFSHCCGSTQTGATLLRHASSVTEQNVGTCCAKRLTGFKIYATSANKCQHYCGSMQMDATYWAQQCCVLLFNSVAPVCMGLYVCSIMGHSLGKKQGK